MKAGMAYQRTGCLTQNRFRCRRKILPPYEFLRPGKFPGSNRPAKNAFVPAVVKVSFEKLSFTVKIRHDHNLST